MKKFAPVKLTIKLLSVHTNIHKYKNGHTQKDTKWTQDVCTVKLTIDHYDQHIIITSYLTSNNKQTGAYLPTPSFKS